MKCGGVAIGQAAECGGAGVSGGSGACVCVLLCLRACLPLRGARPRVNPGSGGGAARSRWGHCAAPCINNSRRARESGGVCLPAQ